MQIIGPSAQFGMCRILLIFVAFLGVFGGSASAQVQQFTPETFSQVAIDEAQPGTQFVFAQGRYQGPIIFDGGLYDVIGNGNVTIVGTEAYPAIAALNAAVVQMRGISIEGLSDEQPALLVGDSSFTHSDGSLRAAKGDGIAVFSGVLQLVNSTVQIGGGGTAIIGSTGSVLAITESQISSDGSALFVSGADALEIRGSAFVGAVSAQVSAVKDTTEITASSFMSSSDETALKLLRNGGTKISNAVIRGDSKALEIDLAAGHSLDIEASQLIGTSIATGPENADASAPANLTISDSIISNTLGKEQVDPTLILARNLAANLQSNLLRADADAALVYSDGASVEIEGSVIETGEKPIQLVPSSNETVSSLSVERSLFTFDPQQKASEKFDTWSISAHHLFGSSLEGELTRAKRDNAAEDYASLKAISQAAWQAAAEQLENAGTLSVVARDIANQTRAAGFSAYNEDDSVFVFIEDPGIAEILLPAGTYTVESLSDEDPQSAQIDIKDGELRTVGFDLNDTVFMRFTAGQRDEKSELITVEIPVQLIPAAERGSKFASLFYALDPSLRQPRPDAKPEFITAAVQSARSYLDNLTPKTNSAASDQRKHSFQFQLARAILVHHGSAEDAGRVSLLNRYTIDIIAAQNAALSLAHLDARTTGLQTGQLLQSVLSDSTQLSEAEFSARVSLLQDLGSFDLDETTQARLLKSAVPQSDKSFTTLIPLHSLRKSTSPSIGKSAADAVIALSDFHSDESDRRLELMHSAAVLIANGSRNDLTRAFGDSPLFYYTAIAPLLPLVKNFEDVVALSYTLEDSTGLILARGVFRHFSPANRQLRLEQLDNAISKQLTRRLREENITSINRRLTIQAEPQMVRAQLGSEKVEKFAAEMAHGRRGLSVSTGVAFPGFAAGDFNKARRDYAANLLKNGPVERSDYVYLNALDYLSSAELETFLKDIDLSAWPDPELIRLALLTTVSRFEPDDLRAGVYHRHVFARESEVRVPFVMMDKPQEEGAFGGAMHGILMLEPKLSDGVLAVTARLEFSNFYAPKCGLGTHIETDGCKRSFWRTHPYAAPNADKLIENFEIQRNNTWLPTNRFAANRETTFDIDHPDSPDFDGLSARISLRYGETRHKVIIPLWKNETATVLRQKNRLVADANRAIDAAPSQPMPYIALAGVHVKFDQPYEALSSYLDASARAPDPIDVLLDGADTLFGAGFKTEASALLNRGLDTQPNQPDLLFTAGSLAFIEQNYRESLRLFERLANVTPGDASVISRQAEAAFFTGAFGYSATLFGLLPQESLSASSTLLALLANRAESEQSLSESPSDGDDVAFLQNLTELINARTNQTAISEGLVQLATAPVEGLLPNHCDALAFGAWWLRFGKDVSNFERYRSAAQESCESDQSMGWHLSEFSWQDQ
jgi:hypothetical protein